MNRLELPRVTALRDFGTADEFLGSSHTELDLVAKKVALERLVFVDEMGANTSLSPLRAWSRTGERAYCSMLRNRGNNTTLLASIDANGMGPSLSASPRLL